MSGESQAQGYGAVPAAAALGGAVLLTRPDGIPKVTAAELDRLDPDRIVLVGGGTVLRAAVERAAAAHAPAVERVDGDSRAGTSLALARFAFTTATTAWVVSRDHPEHAVVAAAAAAGQRSPLLVVDGDAPLSSAHADLLRDLGVTAVTVVGPTAAVSTRVADDLEELVGEGHVQRASGEDRYAVAARVDALAHPSLPKGVAYLANGRAPTTAFAGAVLAGLSQRPLLYSLPYCVPASARAALVDKACHEWSWSAERSSTQSRIKSGELAALQLELLVEPRVGQRDRRLAGERGEQVAGFVAEGARGEPTHDERSDDAVRPHERDHHQRAPAGVVEQPQVRVELDVGQVGHLHRHP